MTSPTYSPAQHAVPACFFDPTHGAAFAMAAWQPPYGVTRPIPVCPGCQQRLLAQSQPVPPQPAPDRRAGGSGMGDVVLGAAGGLAGGMLLGSLFDDSGSEDDDWL
ncbi:hypothetical protein ACIP5Y_14225 [Nocardia sp. NPDC088792]|uniref:hypothetical protein n=1 Tax=Nocardia sp. NPDC088792 TaxID=3364332 RepID=UPI003818C540